MNWARSGRRRWRWGGRCRRRSWRYLRGPRREVRLRHAVLETIPILYDDIPARIADDLHRLDAFITPL